MRPFRSKGGGKRDLFIKVFCNGEKLKKLNFMYFRTSRTFSWVIRLVGSGIN